MKRFFLIALLLISSPAWAQKPPINGVAGPTTSAQFGGIITNPFGSPSTGDRVLFATPANNGVLVTSPSGMPSISTTLPDGLAMGTPTSITLTGATGLPISTGVSGLGTGVATFLGTPSSANLAAALTDETGTGLAVFNNSPTLLGTIATSGATTTGPSFTSSVTGDSVARVAVGLNANDTARFSAGPGNASRDTFLERAAAANWRFGTADAASPVAQTTSVQNVATGTSNTAGADRTYAGSQGTGTGCGGSHLFKVAAAGTSGSTQNALSLGLKLDCNGQLSVVSIAEDLNGLPTPSISSNVLTLDYRAGSVQAVTSNANINTFSIVNMPTVGALTLILTGDGNTYTQTGWSSGSGNVLWPSNIAPALTTTSGKQDVLTFVTKDGGSHWLGFVGGQNF